MMPNGRTGKFRLCTNFDQGLALLSDLNDYPMDQDVHDSIRRVRAKPCDVDFDIQVEASEELYVAQPPFSLVRQYMSKILNSVRKIYSKAVITNIEQTASKQIHKHQVYFSLQRLYWLLCVWLCSRLRNVDGINFSWTAPKVHLPAVFHVCQTT